MHPHLIRRFFIFEIWAFVAVSNAVLGWHGEWCIGIHIVDQTVEQMSSWHQMEYNMWFFFKLFNSNLILQKSKMTISTIIVGLQIKYIIITNNSVNTMLLHCYYITSQAKKNPFSEMHISDLSLRNTFNVKRKWQLNLKKLYFVFVTS